MRAINLPDTIHIAAVISAHGFGHAARACAVLECLQAKCSNLMIEIFSGTPEWFFKESLGDGFNYHHFPTDVGIIQLSPFEEDLRETCEQLSRMYLYGNGLAGRLASQISAAGSKLVLCDISPLGILAASIAGISSVLIENFTWDWIYAGYFQQEPGLVEIARSLKSIFDSVSIHIQAEPICVPKLCNIVAKPIARRPRQSKEHLRKRLGLPDDHKLILVTGGGIEQQYPGLEGLGDAQNGITFVVPGSSRRMRKTRNAILLPHHSGFYHPDLVYASDAVVGKLGYSTIAEAYYAGIPFGYVPREHFRETEPLAGFVKNNLGGFEIGYQEFSSGRWVVQAPRLLENARQERFHPNGATEVAEYIYEKLLADGQ